MASAIPVLPDGASITVCPGLMVPRRSASSMIAIARRSFTDDSGLKASHLTYISAPGGASLGVLATGVLPIVPRMVSWITRILLSGDDARHDGDEPRRVAQGISDRGDHVREVVAALVDREARMLGDRVGIAVAPGLPDRGEGFAGHAQRVD